MPIGAALNTSYLYSNLVNQKYQPLSNITVSQTQADECATMITDRTGVFTTFNIDLFEITFFGDNINKVPDREAATGMLPPLVAISSNRSKWIKAQYAEGAKMLSDPTTDHFTGLADKTALQLGPVPLYAPYRIAAAEADNRNVYIFVHKNEYSEYTRNLLGTGINVIGWTMGGDIQCVGFGASRYVAIAFFQYIYRLNGACSKIWMFDDNAVAVNNFTTLADFEGEMDTLGVTGLGFTGGTTTKTDSQITTYAYDTTPPTTLAAAVSAPILQQAVLWNIQTLAGADHNYSPLFFSSAEDGSFTKYLGGDACKYYEGATVFKGSLQATDYDNGTGNLALNAMKRRLVNEFYNARSVSAFTSTISSTITNLDQLIAQIPSTTSSKEPTALTYSKAIEQTLYKAIENGIRFGIDPDIFTFSDPYTITLKNA